MLLEERDSYFVIIPLPRIALPHSKDNEQVIHLEKIWKDDRAEKKKKHINNHLTELSIIDEKNYCYSQI